MTSKSARSSPSRSVPCPSCRTPSTWEGNPYRPFCSERCQTMDQAAWADEKYAIPSEDAPPIDGGEEH